MRHQFSDLIQFQYTAVMPHMRLISGSTEGAEVDKNQAGLEVEVRIPAWSKPAEVQARIDGEPQQITRFKYNDPALRSGSRR